MNPEADDADSGQRPRPVEEATGAPPPADGEQRVGGAELPFPTQERSPAVPPVLPADTAETEDHVSSGQMHRLHPNYVPVNRISGWIGAGVLGILLIGGVAGLLIGASMPLWLKVLLVLALLIVLTVLIWSAHFWPPIDYRYRWYRVDDKVIELRKGVWWREILSVPRSRIQHIDVHQGPIARRFGLASLVVHTAGSLSNSVTIEGLGYETAIRLRDHLIETGSSDAV